VLASIRVARGRQLLKRGDEVDTQCFLQDVSPIDVKMGVVGEHEGFGLSWAEVFEGDPFLCLFCLYFLQLGLDFETREVLPTA